MAINSYHEPGSDNLEPVDREVDLRSERPQVYRAAHTQDDWIVEPPGGAITSEGRMIFAGSSGPYRALIYALEKFGCARFFPY